MSKTRTLLNTGPISSTPEGKVVATPLVTHVVLPQIQTRQSGIIF